MAIELPVERDEKYIVFKRKPDRGGLTNGPTYMPEEAIDDAVVIRMQDVFAHAAFSVYANSIALVAGILRSAATDETTGVRARQLQDIADYFSKCAEDSYANQDKKLPD
jgi:hypothetical protein